jgi:predicted transcriptional regulator
MVERASVSAYFSGVLRPAQCRAARVLLGWTQDTLSEKADVKILTLRRFEAGKTDPRSSTRDAIEKALVDAGVELMETADGIGVWLRFRQ